MHDTIAIAERLEEAGVQQRAAKVIAQEIANNGERLATKEDIDRLEQASKEDVGLLRKDFGRLEQSTKENFGLIRKDFDRLEQSTKEDVRRSERRILTFMGLALGLFAVLQSGITALILWLFMR